MARQDDHTTVVNPDAPASTASAATLSLAAEYSERVNFAMQQNRVPLVNRLTITNEGTVSVHDLTIKISLQNGECEPWQSRVDRIDPGFSFHVEPERLHLNAKHLAARTEAEQTFLEITVASPLVVTAMALPIELLAFDQWPGASLYPEMLAAFVTPNHPAVADLLKSARKTLGELSGQDALDGYQSGSRQRASLIAEACFNSVLSRGVGYINPPASFDSQGQRVRLVDRICREGFGSCLDLSLLLASLWEQAGLHPVILLLQAHAIPAVWTHEAHLPEPAIDEPARIRNLIQLGEIIPVESTLVTQPGATFALAVDKARRRMELPGTHFCAVDILTSRKCGIRPLPLRADGENTAVDIDLMNGDTDAAVTSTQLDPVAVAERAEAMRRVSNESAPRETGDERIDRWKTRLLDLSLRNRLINFRESGRTLRFMVPDVARLEDMLATEARLSIYPKSDGDEAFFKAAVDDRQLYSTETPAEMQKRLLTLYRTARSSIEETGANLLHLAIGMLKWYETESSDAPRYAPLILLPVQLSRIATGGGYRYELSLSEEPLRPNVTLLEKLRTDFAIDTSGLRDIPEDENGIDVPLLLHRVRAAIRETKKWEVEESAFLGLFSFNKFLMWRDLQENLTRLRQNRLVRHLVDRTATDFDPNPFPRPESLDDEVSPDAMFCTRDADSSQLAAIRAAAEHRTFVLEGPPGTGKSQTIANIIANSLAHGERVLFVAEKMAALSVVSRRLKDDGLRPFCLELHSAKASKKEVLEQLREAHDAIAIAEPPNWPSLCAEMGSTRKHLNSYVRELHLSRATGESLYRVIGRLTLLGEGATVVPTSQDITKVTKDQLDGWRTAIASLMANAQPIDPPHQHPLYGIGRSEWDFSLPQQARSCLSAAQASANQLLAATGDFVATFDKREVAATLGRNAVEALAVLASILPSSPAPPRGILFGTDAPNLLQKLGHCIEIGRRRDRIRNDLLTRYQASFLDIDHLQHLDALNRAATRATPFNIVACFFALRKLRPFCKGRGGGIEQLRIDLELARGVKENCATLASSAEMATLLGPLWNNGEADWDALQKIVEWCQKFVKAASVLHRDANSSALVEPIIALACNPLSTERAAVGAKRLVHSWKDWTQTWSVVKGTLKTSSSSAFGDNVDSGWLSGVTQIITRWLQSLSALNDWCNWQRARHVADERGLADLVKLYDRGELKRSQLADAFERGFGSVWFSTIANAVPSVREFNASSHAQTIDRFRALDRTLIQQTRFAIAARLGSNKPRTPSQVAAQSEVGILRREFEKRSRHLPTRRLIEAVPNLLPRLKPCFLMSPLSVAQYLDTKLPPFDLVLFDEASQIPVWDAVGAIARGTEVIVVGDSKQLPPTNFFNTLDGEDEPDVENAAIEDLESILKECNASGIPAMRLIWHYRSKHESLIAFSNHHYYDNALHTFPSPVDRSDELGVTFRHVADGVYDRGNSRTNRVEASKVVDEIVTLLTTSSSPDSIGVVTFNRAQQTLIEDLLDAKRREIPAIEKFFTNEVPESVFVKNLESVQGDERDTIIFSVGYGPDQTGRPSMNFGPLNQDGGERRLNVAITRARKRLIVFSSLRSDQIDLRRTMALGVKHFKTFLDYAERGRKAIAEAIDYSGVLEFDSGFERAVCDALIKRGYEVDTQVGCAGYRVDVAVRDPNFAGRYLIGIECDGAAYHSARTARDRDRLRQSVLESLGWRIERVWSTDWFINADRCLSTLVQSIENAKAAKPSEPHHRVTQPVADIEVLQPQTHVYASGPPTLEPPAPTQRHAPYRIAVNDSGTGGFDVFDQATTPRAIASLKKIVDAEGPIVEELALRRFAHWFDIDRVTDRFRKRFAEICGAAQRSRQVVVADDALWPSHIDPCTYTECRVASDLPKDQRDVEFIPLVERVNGVVHVVSEQIGLPREALIRETASLFGAHRVTERVRQIMEVAVDAAVAGGHVRIDDGKAVLAD